MSSARHLAGRQVVHLAIMMRGNQVNYLASADNSKRSAVIESLLLSIMTLSTIAAAMSHS